jgi:hypothetical protein
VPAVVWLRNVLESGRLKLELLVEAVVAAVHWILAGFRL